MSEKSAFAGVWCPSVTPFNAHGAVDNRPMLEETSTVCSDFAVLSGYDEYLLPNLLAGGAGVISGLNNIVPEYVAQMMAA